MRIAVIADIHGNVLALEAVLADIARRGADLTVNLGDVVSGPLWPRETYERLAPLNLPTVRGNHDRALCEPVAGLGASDRYAVEQLQIARKPGRWEHFPIQEMPPDACKALAALPPTLTPAPGILACHGTPASDLTYLLDDVADGTMMLAPTAVIAKRLGGASAGLVLCGHSHIPRAVQIGPQLIVNPGSVGCPGYLDPTPPAHVSEAGSPHARYAIADNSSGTWAVELIALTYDWDRAATRAQANGRPEWAMALATGRVR
jgi:predicted phosphodiesterase